MGKLMDASGWTRETELLEIDDAQRSHHNPGLAAVNHVAVRVGKRRRLSVLHERICFDRPGGCQAPVRPHVDGRFDPGDGTSCGLSEAG
ncbi:hypothetical protein [Paraburkholderia jirisanensis]